MLFLSGVVLTVITELFLGASCWVWLSAERTVICQDIYRHYSDRFSVFDPVCRRRTSDPCRQRPSMAMISNLAGAVINTVLDALFVFGFNMGMQGAHWQR